MCHNNYRTVISAFDMKILNDENVPTRITNTTSTLIDHVWSDIPNIKTDSKIVVEDCSYSDHKILSIHLNLPLPKKDCSIKKVFKRVDRDLLEISVRSSLIEIQNPTIDDIIRIIQNGKREASTEITRTIRSASHGWITLRILDEIKKRERLFKVFKRSSLQQDQSTYKRQRQNVKALIAKTKKDLLINQLHQAEGDSRKIWNVIKGRVGSSTKKSCVIDKLMLS